MKVIGNLTKDAIIRAAVSEGQNVTQVIGTPVVFEAAQTNPIDITYDSNAQKVVIAYKDHGNSSYGTAIVGTVSGNSISFGSPAVFESAATNYTRIVYDSNAQKVVIVYRDEGNSNYGTAIVGTVSGTSISFGTPTVYSSATSLPYDITYDSNAQKVVVAYRHSDNTGYGIVGTISGTGISFGSATQFNSGNTGRIRAAYDTNAQRVVFAYEDAGNSSHGTAVVGTVSGTSISFGSEVVFEAATSSEVGMAYDSDSQKIVIGYRDQGDSNIGKAIVGTVSGTSISFGTAAAFGAGNDEYITVVYDSDAQKIVVAYRDSSTDGKLNVGTVSGTSITFGDEVQFESGNSNYVNAAYDSVQKRVVIAYQDAGNSSHGTAVVTKTGYTSATGGTIADGSAVIVNANGTVSTVSQTTNSESLGAEVQFNGQNSVYTSACFDSAAGKCVVFYRDSGASNAGKYIVGTISGQSITYGSEDFFASASRTQYNSAVFEPVAGKVVIAYQDQDGSFYGKVRVGTLSGTSITWGTPVTFNSNETTYIEAVYHTGEGKIVVAYKNSSNYARAIAGTVSGNSISFGTGVDVDTSGGNYMTAVYHTAAQKVVTAFKATSSIGCCRVLTLSGTTITVGARQSFITTGQANQGAIAYDTTSETVVIAFRDEANTTYGSIVAGSVSGDTITYGSLLTFQSGSIDWLGIRGFASAGGVILAYDNNSSSPTNVPVKYFTISGTTITLVSTVTFYSGGGVGNRSYGFAEDTANDKMLLAFNADGIGRSKVYNPTFSTTNLTTENFVGFMKGAALDGTNGEILSSCSIARNQTSLTAGQTYFVTPAGTLSLTAGSPSVTAGTAISSTELIVKG